jgi:hypothetical protein
MIDIQTAIPIVVAVTGVVSTVVVGKKWLALKNVCTTFATLVSVYFIRRADGTFSPADNEAIVACVGQFLDALEKVFEIVRPE